MSITLPSDVSDEVEVVVSSFENKQTTHLGNQDTLMQAKAMDETGFVKTVNNAAAEDCWNAL